jgi:hypothetical protein
MSETGEFVRDTRYLDGRITADGRDGWPVLAGKYRLVVARGFPWANRTMIVRRLLGLEPALSMGICGPEHDWRSWSFDLFQTPGFGDTIDFVQTKQHYYRVHTDLNPTQIVPAGPDLSGWLTPHNREELGSRPFGDGTPPGPPPAAERVAPGHGAVLKAGALSESRSQQSRAAASRVTEICRPAETNASKKDRILSAERQISV